MSMHNELAHHLAATQDMVHVAITQPRDNWLRLLEEHAACRRAIAAYAEKMTIGHELAPDHNPTCCVGCDLYDAGDAVNPEKPL